MKKLLILAICALMMTPVFAQEASSDNSSSPGFRFGIKVTPNVSWFRPADVKALEGNGGKVKIGFGLITEFSLAKNYSFATGIEFPNFSGGNLKFKTDSVSYTTEESDTFYIASRSYNLQYVEIPLTLKLKTNEIGYLTYFGHVGAQLGVRTKATSKDEGVIHGSNTNTEIKDVDINKEVFLLKAALTIGAGAEYNFSGNTSLVFGLNYMYGITNALKKQSTTLRNVDGTPFQQKANLDQVVLTVGVLF